MDDYHLHSARRQLVQVCGFARCGYLTVAMYDALICRPRVQGRGDRTTRWSYRRGSSDASRTGVVRRYPGDTGE